MSIRNFFSSYYGLPRSVFILFIARVIHSIGSFVYPFLTMLLTIKLGYCEEIAGYYVTGVIVAGSIGLILGGKLADKFGRKKIFLILSFMSATIFVACAFVTNPEIIPWLLIISNLFLGGVLPTINAMLADLTSADKRKAAFSLIYLGTNIGVAIGPLIAGFLFNEYMKLLFLIDAATTYLSLILVIFLVRETIPTKEKIMEVSNSDNRFEKPEKGNIFIILLKRPIFLIFTFISLVYVFIYSQNYFSVPIYLNEIFSEMGPKIYGSLMSVNAIVVILLTIFLINLMKNTKPIINIAFAGVLYAIGFGIFFLVSNRFLLIGLTIIWTLGEIVQTINTNVYVAENSPITHRARFSSVVSFITELGFIISPIIMGYFIKHFGINNIWLPVIIISISAALMMYMLYLADSNRNNRSRKKTII
jgi:MFS family permease